MNEKNEGALGVTTCPGCQRGPDCAETCAALGVAIPQPGQEKNHG